MTQNSKRKAIDLCMIIQIYAILNLLNLLNAFNGLIDVLDGMIAKNQAGTGLTTVG